MPVMTLNPFKPLAVNDPRLADAWYCDTNEDGDVIDRASEPAFVNAVIYAAKRLADEFFV